MRISYKSKLHTNNIFRLQKELEECQQLLKLETENGNEKLKVIAQAHSEEIKQKNIKINNILKELKEVKENFEKVKEINKNLEKNNSKIQAENQDILKQKEELKKKYEKLNQIS